jgi:peptide/nickel transport system permease protein
MAFGAYLAKRFATIFVTLFLIVNIQFLVFQVVSPVNPVSLMISKGFTQETQQMLRRLYGIDRPLSERYILYITNLYTFRFGVSFISRRPVIEDIMTYLPNTLYLLGSAMVLQLLIGIIAGLTAASKRGTWWDVVIVTIGLIAWAMPAFIVQLVFRFVFAQWLGWFPYGLMMSYPPPTDTASLIQNVLYHTALPLTTLALMGFGGWAFYARNLLIDVMTQDYVLTARAKGLKEGTIVRKHAFRVILPPIVTMVLVDLPGLITGALITEYIFSWPGIGWWLINATMHGDYPAVQGLFFIYSILMLLTSFVADLTYGYLDPRIRVGLRR